MHPPTQGVHLLPFDATRDLPTLDRWLRAAHVAPWWGSPDDVISIVRQHPPAARALIAVGETPVGFLIWQTPTRKELSDAGLGDLPAHVIDIDVLIGEPEYLGRGVGPRALTLLVDRLRGDGTLLVGLGTSEANQRAVRAFQKAGFQLYRTYEESGGTMCYFVQVLRKDG